MRDLIVEPLWAAGDLGTAIPDTEHGVSVCLPTWADVVGYEEKEERVVAAMRCGYPRFFCHPKVRALFEEAENRDGAGRRAVVLPSEGAALRCREFVKARDGIKGDVAAYGDGDLWVYLVEEAGVEGALKYWQHSGEIVSSRLASAVLSGKEWYEGEEAKAELRERLAGLSGQGGEDVFLYQNGMSGVYAVHRAVMAMRPGLKSVQLEFPYVDVLKVQEQFGAGAHFFELNDSGDLSELEGLLGREEVSAVYCEMAANPLLRSVDLEKVAGLLEGRGVPLIVDDTVGTVVNVDVYRWADVVTTSLTKCFSGVGDVMGGSVILRESSVFRDEFASFLKAEAPEDLYGSDAAVLAVNSRDFVERVEEKNRTGEAIYEYLSDHPQVERVWYPKGCATQGAYDAVRREGGGYSCLLSFVLKDAATTTPGFYDALRISKGPSLGTNYSLVCPYTLLAYYNELEWAEGCGVSRYLVRLSVGLEGVEELRGRLEEALGGINN
ncbi:MAG: PLP-dependent transferase [Verrucomicrobiota bacterium]